MKKILPKAETKNQIEEFFRDINTKNPKEIKKIKRLAMSHKIPLKDLRKKYCKHCLNPFINPKVKIKKNIKTTICGNCNKVSRWKVK